MPELTRPLLIAITDRRLFQLTPEDWAREAIAGGVDLIQVREKDLSESDLLEFAAQIVNGVVQNETRGSDPGLKTEEPFQDSRVAQSWRDSVLLSPVTSVPGCASEWRVQINANPNIARRLDCGLHLPELDELPSRAPHPLSRSVHGIESATQAKGFDFLIAGHIFATPSKSESDPRGLEWLKDISTAIDIPVVAIGGVHAENAASCIEYGASGIAVISAIAASPEPRIAAGRLRLEIDRAWEQTHG